MIITDVFKSFAKIFFKSVDKIIFKMLASYIKLATFLTSNKVDYTIIKY